jgi:hypothetical protein
MQKKKCEREGAKAPRKMLGAPAPQPKKILNRRDAEARRRKYKENELQINADERRLNEDKVTLAFPSICVHPRLSAVDFLLRVCAVQNLFGLRHSRAEQRNADHLTIFVLTTNIICSSFRAI